MTVPSPLLQTHLDREATIIPYIAPESTPQAEGATLTPSAELVPEVVAQFGHIELEYASLRKGVGIFDMPHRGTVRVRGADTLDFLGRMLTQELKGASPGTVLHSFWLNRKGRIEADLQVVVLEDAIQFDLDIHAAARTCQTLETFVFSEDVSFENASQSLHRLLLVGPGVQALLEQVATPDPSGTGDEAEQVLSTLSDRRAVYGMIAGKKVLLVRDDLPGLLCTALTCNADDVADVYAALLKGNTPTPPRPIGWHAYNIARIEAGVPLYNIDFGSSNLPHETGVLHDRVSFTKGCYLGQEIIARMESRGHSKQMLVGLRFVDQANPELPQPITGSRIFASPTSSADETSAGQITSSTISPMLASVPICFATVQHATSQPGTKLWVETENQRIEATVQNQLTFFPTPSST